MVTLQRARSLAIGGARAVLTGDPAARRRVFDPLRARVLRSSVAGLDPLLGGYVRGAAEVGVDDLMATAHRTHASLLSDAAGVLARRTGDPTWRAAWAELLCTDGDEAEARTGAAVFRELVETGYASRLTNRQSLIFAHTLLRRQAVAGEGARALTSLLPRLVRLSADEHADLETDLANPALTGWETFWWAMVTRRWLDAGMLVPRLLTDAELAEVVGAESVAAFGAQLPAFDRVGPDRAELRERRAGLPARIAAATGREVAPADLPLVSVIVTAYRPGPWLATALRALLDQTWTALEILVVDDASGPEYSDEIARLAALDPRARVITRHRNGGAYRARNLGVAEAKGDYLAFLDADDWCHPERIERQVTPLLADPGLVGTHALALRSDEDLQLAWLGYPAVRHNACGLVMPRSTREVVGSFDDVRKSADSEYNARIEAVTGEEPLMVHPLLHLTRLRKGSLSRSDFGVGWGVGGRLAYRSAYKAWHRHLTSLREAGRLPGERGGSAGTTDDGPDLEWATRHGESDPDRTRAVGRPFAAPHAWVSPHPLPAFDVLVVDDAADTMVDPDELADVLERLRAAGTRVGLLHRENPARMRLSRKPLLPRIRELLDSADDVLQVHPEEHVEAAVMWIRCPEALSVGRPPPDVASGAVVVAEPPRARTHRVEPAWTRPAVEAELETWGVAPGSAQWLPRAVVEERVHHLMKETS